jgi:hypothetical protein
MMPDRAAAVRQILDFFKKRQITSHKQELQDQLHAAVGDHAQSLELLKRLQRADRQDSPDSPDGRIGPPDVPDRQAG